jgi:Major tropism determinant N-terminal domain
MAGILQLRHLTTALRAAYTPLVGEAIWDTTLDELYVGDGTTAGGNLVGAGGIEIAARVLIGAALGLSSGVALTVTSIILTYGTWEVTGTVGFAEAAGTIATEQVAAINTVAATLPTFPSAGTATHRASGTTATADGSILPISPCRIIVFSGTTTAYLIARATFSVSGNAAYGEIRAVRTA